MKQSQRLLASICFVLISITGCATITSRSFEKPPKEAPKAEKQFNAVLIDDDFWVNNDLRDYFINATPFNIASKGPTRHHAFQSPEKFSDIEQYSSQDRDKIDYRIRAVFTHEYNHSFFSWIGFLTLGVIPSPESASVNLAVRVENLKKGQEKLYFYSDHLSYLVSSLPIFWEVIYMGGHEPRDDAVKDLVLKFNKEVQEDLHNGKI